MLTYGGVPLLVPDRGGELHRWIEKHFDFEHAEIFGDCPTWLMGKRFDDRANQQPYAHLPLANYPASPPPRLNTLWWPTGATRWARGYFLVTAENLKKILKQVPRPQALELAFDDNDDSVLLDAGMSMWMLPPRRLTAFPYDTFASYNTVSSRDDQLWLLPLVDERYWWQFKGMGDAEFDDSLTWDSLFSAIGIALGATIEQSEIDSRYLRPDPAQFNRIRDNAAMVFEAAALSIGRRVVRSWLYDESVRVEDRDDADSWIQYNNAQCGEPVAGGYHAAQWRPDGVSVSYPQWQSDEATGELAHFSHTPLDTANSVSGTRKQVFSSACYRLPEATDTCSLNYTLLECLTKAIGEDWLSWLRDRHTFIWEGIRTVEPCGLYNAVTWEISRPENSADGLSCLTRVDPLPENFGVEHQLSQTPELTTGTTTTAAPTTTTSFPVAACDGRCKWVWNASTLQWSLDTDGCNTTSTTTSTTGAPTSSTTEGPTTSTTANPCACTTTTPDPATSTSTSTSTTTTPAPCQCLKPTFCGEMDGDCTWTICGQGGNNEPNCGQSTTTTTSTTPYPCDCNTTTTTEAPCSGGCHWVGAPVDGGLGWVLYGDNGCVPPTGNVFIGPTDCRCDPPTSDAVLCATTETPCYKPTTTTDGPPHCTDCVPKGGCTWVWVDQLARWYIYDTTGDCGTLCCALDPTDVDPCVRLSRRCACPPPSFDGSGCGLVFTPCELCRKCVEDFTSTTTTPDPSTCWQCYTSTSTTTSTTSGPCNQFCEWQGHAAGNWMLGVNPCPSDCPCAQPGYDAQADCERAVTKCGGGTTSTSTSSTSTTEQPTTTSTTSTTSSTSTSTTTTTASPTTSTTTAAPQYYCATLVASDDCNDYTKVQCYETPPVDGNICGGPYVVYADCVNNCPATTTPSPTTTTTTTTAAPTTTTSTSTTNAPADYYCWDCGINYNCGQTIVHACGGGTGGPISGPYPDADTCYAACATPSSTTTTTAAPTTTTSTTTAPTTTTTAGPTTTTTSGPGSTTTTTTSGGSTTTTAAPSQWFCVQMDPFCESTSFCSQGVPEGYTQCGGPFPDNTCGGACICCI